MLKNNSANSPEEKEFQARLANQKADLASYKKTITNDWKKRYSIKPPKSEVKNEQS